MVNYGHTKSRPLKKARDRVIRTEKGMWFSSAGYEEEEI
jgi:hypothetical protein